MYIHTYVREQTEEIFIIVIRSSAFRVTSNNQCMSYLVVFIHVEAGGVMYET